MSTIQKFDKMFGVLFNILDNLVKILIACMTILVVVQVILRNVFNSSIRWAEEVCLIGMVWVTFSTVAVGVRNDIHMRIEMFVQWMDKRQRRALEFCNNLVVLFTGIMMTYYGWLLFQHGFSSTLAATKFPTAVVYLPIPIMGTLITIQMLLRLTGITKSETADKFIDAKEEEVKTTDE